MRKVQGSMARKKNEWRIETVIRPACQCFGGGGGGGAIR